MDWSKLASNVASLAPGLGAAIGGPVGAVAGLGVKALCSLFGVDSQSDDAAAQVEKALSGMTPEQALALKDADRQFVKDMKALDVDVFRLEVQDRDSARRREASAGSKAITAMAFIIVGGFLGMVYGLLSGGLEAVDSTLAGTLIGYVSAKAEQVVSYYFGSSLGSARKTELSAQTKGAVK